MKIMVKSVFEAHLLQYLEAVGGVKITKPKSVNVFVCPLCKTNPASASVLVPVNIYNCLSCKVKGKIFDIVRKLEKDKKDYTDEEIMHYLKELLKLDCDIKSDIDKVLEFYHKNGFDLVPVAKNQKAPIELDWTNKTHREIKEWESWLYDSGINISVKTGECSNLTVIDIDKTDRIPEDISKIMGETLIQKTNSGYHLFYKYVPEFHSTRIETLKTDILNNGKSCVLYPSVVEDVERKYISDFNIIEIPKELKDYLLKQIEVPQLKTYSEKLQEDLLSNNLHLDLVGEGNRNNFLVHLGGILRKELSLSDTGFVLNLCNKKFCKPPLENKEFRNIIKILDKYVDKDDKELSQKILNYLKIVEEAGSRDIKETLNENKERIEKALSYLVKEGLLLKHRRMYHIIKKADWKEEFPNLTNEVPFEIPYFNDSAVFNWGDLLLLGGQNKSGKTTISVNFLKAFIEQGYKPYYICLETGSRWVKTAAHLGLKAGDLFYDFVADPTKIELEPNAITIIDWLLVIDKSQTDTVFKHFIEQLYKTNGFLIIFMQLKYDNNWFAPNMVNQFPSLSARYLYDKEDDGTYGKWVIDVVREPKGNYKSRIIPCKYDFESKLLLKVEDVKTEPDFDEF
jgi:hypothetical protein